MSLQLPEHEKLKAIKPLSQAVYDFLEWCGEQGLVLCAFDGDKWGGTYNPTNEARERLLARHFEIDLAALEREKEAIIAEMHALNSERRHGT